MDAITSLEFTLNQSADLRDIATSENSTGRCFKSQCPRTDKQALTAMATRDRARLLAMITGRYAMLCEELTAVQQAGTKTKMARMATSTGLAGSWLGGTTALLSSKHAGCDSAPRSRPSCASGSHRARGARVTSETLTHVTAAPTQERQQT